MEVVYDSQCEVCGEYIWSDDELVTAIGTVCCEDCYEEQEDLEGGQGYET